MRDQENLLAINVGFSFLTRVSSIPGSPTFIYSQPLINSRVYFAPWILLGAQVVSLLGKRFLQIKEIPILDVAQGRLSFIPLDKFLGFLMSLNDPTGNSRNGDIFDELSQTSSSTASGLDFPTQLPSDVPMYIALYLSADYSRELYTPSMIVYVPFLSFPGLKGALPFLVLALLGTILVRCVVDPKTTGAKP